MFHLNYDICKKKMTYPFDDARNSFLNIVYFQWVMKVKN